MRAISQTVKTLGLVVSQPGVHGVSVNTELLGYLGDSHPVPDDCQDGVISLFHLAELPEHSATSRA
jgi:hypothetical protein